ncbi:putative onanonoxo-7-onima-8-eninoihtemlysoneda protein [Botrytis fragariae]|uniref:Putative onanonoxo-7-onima-8-eninoihtemlysoneda protein n=1 Tax=Botrytis fragariae TaxID=1964551 RepID=A0A8H6EHI2_9HELO|nr:putative onanonoxo-7-onima-8-eninoihtemlysoneda protein [Botrytis fragariae]KAF5872403.1 putative onanonoxo-7-onima-8-eninoihtemlysoneda protein [Botrytis fragariae]
MYKPPPSLLSRSLPVYHLTASNTSLGKTIFSTLLCRQLLAKKQIPYYLKPVSTGPLSEADDVHIEKFAKGSKIACLFRYGEAVSPHIAARGVKPPNDHEIVTAISNQVQKWTRGNERRGEGMIIVEGAGGVHSPTPSGTSQVDALRPLRMPVFLVGDPKLGGISATISAWESLHLRGYDIDSVLIFQEEKYGNYAYLSKYFQERGVNTTVIPPPPNQLPNLQEDEESMSSYYSSVAQSGEIEALLEASHQRNISRIEDLEQMATKAHEKIWYPFTQMKHLSADKILPIDSAYGDYFQTLSTQDASKSQEPTRENLLIPTLDGSGSWWTQGLGHGNPALSLAAAYASGRYGHCIFASTVHAPSLKLAEHLLTNLKNPRLSRVFYSDNGSTGMEVAVKMALTATTKHYRWGNSPEKSREVGIIGLKGSYHGDTIGAMDLSEGSVYNEKVHWYKGRGLWFDVPKIWMKDGKWVVYDGTGQKIEQTFDELESVFNSQRDNSKLKKKYEEHILAELRKANEQGMKFGALVLEPIILGAGGMLFCDPLFQRTLTNVIREIPEQLLGEANPPPEGYKSSPTRWTGLPVIHDEVFTGLYRLGHFSPSTLLHTHPDISVHAKLLTGGLLPLCTTVASESIYEAFLGDEKSEALLHGHSYTGHAVGCEVARVGLETMDRLDSDKNGAWEGFRNDWDPETKKSVSKSAIKMDKAHENNQVWSIWSKSFVTSISHLESVDGVIALGSVLAITFKDEQGGGYTSRVTEAVRESMLDGKVEGIDGEWNIHARILGNVVYLMGSQVMTMDQVKSIQDRLGGILGL